MKTIPKLRIVDEAIDIGKLIRADVKDRDWAAVHIAAERRKPINLPDAVRRWWR